jgi:hypothetical protein
MDGITIRHPRCAVDGCKLPLATARDRYCLEHRSSGSLCSIRGCEESIVTGKLTCANALHQAIENIYEMRGQSHFQLQEHCQHARDAHPVDSIAEECSLNDVADEEEVEEEFTVNDSAAVIPTTSTNFPQLQVKKRLKAQFGQKQTHNEQVLVTPHGIILACETFYGAEAISSCVVCDLWFLDFSQYLKTYFPRNSSRGHFVSMGKCQVTFFLTITVHLQSM